MENKKILVIAIYSHPEYYPPTLNAVEYLAREYDEVYIIHRNVTGFKWHYPANIKLISAPMPIQPRQAENSSLLHKISWFVHFSRLLLRTLKKTKTDTVLLYDVMPVLAYRLIHRFITTPRVLWYHNHDVTDLNYIRKWSLGWWAWRSEKWIFPKLNIFSLPAVERKECFPMRTLNGRFFFIPNFPSIHMYGPFANYKKDTGSIRLLYQGSIGPQHGLEEIIPLLGRQIQGREVFLLLKGFISEEYLLQLQALAEKCGVVNKLINKGAGDYQGVIENAVSCHIGIGIHKKNDTMNNTLGTASNKIYEYAASGLPVLLYDNVHFREHLQHYKWAFFTDCTANSLTSCLNAIVKEYDVLSDQARNDFSTSLNFEIYFAPVVSNLNQL